MKYAPSSINTIPHIVLTEIYSLKIINDKMGAKAGFIKKTADVLTAEVSSIAKK